jgi:hypothetical protein
MPSPTLCGLVTYYRKNQFIFKKPKIEKKSKSYGNVDKVISRL